MKVDSNLFLAELKSGDVTILQQSGSHFYHYHGYRCRKKDIRRVVSLAVVAVIVDAYNVMVKP